MTLPTSVYATSSDLDGDGLPDGVDADRDGDGIPNAIEVTNLIDPDNPADADLDSDLDSFSNVDEYRFGTDLTDAASNPLNQTNSHQQTFGSDSSTWDLFSWSVAVLEDVAVVGALQLNFPDESGPGAAYVFNRNKDGVWIENARLNANDGTSGDQFGIAIALTSENLLICASQDDDNGIDSGSVYAFSLANDGTWEEKQKLLASDGEPGDMFGSSISIFGDTIVVGASGDENQGVAAGAAYVFELDQNGEWHEQAKLIPFVDGLTPGDNDQFGRRVGIYEDIIVIGAPHTDSEDIRAHGAAYIYTRDENGNWNFEAKLVATDAGVGDQFGDAVAINADTLMVGAQGDSTHGVYSGAVYVFEKDSSNEWLEIAELSASDARESATFGRSVALGDDIAVIGSHRDSFPHTNSGSAYIFVRSETGEWSELVRLQAIDIERSHKFGFSTALSGKNIVIGSYGDRDVADFAGAAYFFNLDVDGDGLLNSIEDLNNNGVVDSTETNFFDADTDDDGLRDGDEDANANGQVDPGETDPLNADSDFDGIQDGTELGTTAMVAPAAGTLPLFGTDPEFFVPDADQSTTTNPTSNDSDDDGFSDGAEDLNRNGRVDQGESDPNNELSIPLTTTIPVPIFVHMIIFILIGVLAGRNYTKFHRAN